VFRSLYFRPKRALAVSVVRADNLPNAPSICRQIVLFAVLSSGTIIPPEVATSSGSRHAQGRQGVKQIRKRFLQRDHVWSARPRFSKARDACCNAFHDTLVFFCIPMPIVNIRDSAFAMV